MKYEKFFGNFNGRKVDSTLLSKGTLENYILSFGYNIYFVDPLHPDPKIAATRQFKKFCRVTGTPVFTPMIIVDGVFDLYAMNYGYLRLEHIEEIYYKVGGPLCEPDLFIVFTNEKYKNKTVVESEKNAKQFTVENGHDTPLPFKRPEYHSKTSSSFEHYGIISWVPKAVSNEQGVISIKVPNDGQEQLKLLIHGFSENGELISDELFVDLSEGK